MNYLTKSIILNTCILASSHSYKHHITKYFERLPEEKDFEIFFIINFILKTIVLHIRLTWLLKTSTSKLVFNINGKILEKLIIIKKIYIKLIFQLYVSLA